MFYGVLFICFVLYRKSYFIFQIILVDLIHFFYSIKNFTQDFIQNFVLLVVGLLSMKEDGLFEIIQDNVFCSKMELLQGTCYEGAFVYGNHLVLLLQNLQLKIYLFMKC